ncbi:uncharacterized protein M437DRAFT_61800 [Aureobasidium melanogenum CBS 110374]|uniref:Uncharacterized protein n=1 Tax=Aureobasidium melanogenum (strain CBS 110374) TaxID=1043003 RepID=A0A074W2P9_AURM1|nr:uncharacterized protein M437DRAFT_61800 [Aureobasidium melanogenum CBS 110374]KEQ67390.1 hypothetical protein M437DRAFT_61800 [Aureobasidium melanogenum CBS 110374]
MACTVAVIATGGSATVIMGSKLIKYLNDPVEDEQKELADDMVVAIGVIVLAVVFFRVIFTLAWLESDVTVWIFNGVVARSCAEVCVTLGLLKLAAAALHTLRR